MWAVISCSARYERGVMKLPGGQASAGQIHPESTARSNERLDGRLGRGPPQLVEVLGGGLKRGELTLAA